ncbi:hypothetical protein AZOA_17670 [Azoarcus sp. Aa7]|nr:hypothetical protein [Azoarcus sp. Aa7]
MQTRESSARAIQHSDHGTPLRATVIWVVLIAATIVTWSMGENGSSGPAVVGLLFAIAFGKGAMIILDYMALRRAPLMWPLLALGWMTLVCALIGIAYWKGLAA